MKLTSNFTVLTLLLIATSAAYASILEPTEKNLCRLYPPGKTWAFEIDLGELAKCEPDYGSETGDAPSLLRNTNTAKIAKSDGRPRIVLFSFSPLSGRPTNIGYFTNIGSFKVVVEAGLQGDAETLRTTTIQEAIKAKRIRKDGIKSFQYKHIPIVRYTFQPSEMFESLSLPPMAGLEAYLVEDNTSIIIRLVAGPVKEAEEKIFYSLLDSLRVVDISNPTTSFDYSQLAHARYQQKDYSKAIEAVNKALALETQRRDLTLAQWRMLVEDATDIFGAVGQIERSREILEYGISNDPTYPYFHLGLARLHAAKGELDLLVSRLVQAFQYAKQDATVVDGRLPDPMHDPAFAAFRKDPKFQAAVKSIKKLR